MSFNLEVFIAQCKSAIADSKPKESVAALVSKAVLDPDSIFAALGQPDRAAIEKIHVSEDLTIINVVWAPKMTLLPHNHNIWAVIGVYAGREDNIFWRRKEDDPDGKIDAAGARSIASGEVAMLGENAIHSVTNPTSAFTSAIHVYGGNFFEVERSEWEPATLTENPYDIEKNMGLFEAENSILKYRN